MLLLDALAGKNRDRPPVWLMRQAGRYLPEYLLLRSKFSLRDLFFTPQLAAEITLMPIERFGFDAAILFSDITAIAPALGLKLSFDEGPVIEPWKNVLWPPDMGALEPVFETVRLIRQNSKVALLGFCGGPFTVASYLIERHDGAALPKTFALLREDPVWFEELLDRLCELSILYLNKQIEAGADAVQIFDSWAHLLQGADWERYCQRYLQRIVAAVSRPAIVFMRQGSLKAKELEKTGAAAISVDGEKPMAEVRKAVRCCLQGNLDPDLLFRPLQEVEKGVLKLLSSMEKDPGFIVNLGHGVKVGTPLESVRLLVDLVKGWRHA